MFLSLFLLLSTTIYAMPIDSSADMLILASESMSFDINTLAETYLSDTIQYTTPSYLGYTDAEFYGMILGSPFSVYTYDDTSCEFISNTFSVPLLYDGNIIGVLEVSFDQNTQSVYYKLGKAYILTLMVVFGIV